MTAHQQTNSTIPAASALRDPRLDFFRGIAMFIILIAHVPGNWLTLWIPARFGFSDATETFVFCSGMASAIAFGKLFERRGWALGTARVWFRIWQVYWAHICLFFAIALSMAVLNQLFPEGRDYIGALNLHPFFNKTAPQLIGLFTLTYVPNYFDILPMYLVILAMMPIFIISHNISKYLALGLVLLLWLCANFFSLNFPAEPWSERDWFFNPLGWQLMFFTGFSFMMGWLPTPPRSAWLFILALAIVLAALPFAYFRIFNNYPEFLEGRKVISDLIVKTDFGILRYVHFLATAYIAWILVGEKGKRILPPTSGFILSKIWRSTLAVIMKVGQQSLAVFVTSMLVARLMGAMLDQVGRTHLSMAYVNILGAALIVAIAYGAGWFKSQPWRKAKVA